MSCLTTSSLSKIVTRRKTEHEFEVYWSDLTWTRLSRMWWTTWPKERNLTLDCGKGPLYLTSRALICRHSMPRQTGHPLEHGTESVQRSLISIQARPTTSRSLRITS